MLARFAAFLLAGLLVGSAPPVPSQVIVEPPVSSGKAVGVVPREPDWSADEKSLAALTAALPHTHGAAALSTLASQAAAVRIRAREAGAEIEVRKTKVVQELRSVAAHSKRGLIERSQVSALQGRIADLDRQADAAAAAAAQASDVYNSVA